MQNAKHLVMTEPNSSCNFSDGELSLGENLQENLVPALIQCFGIIIIGYIVGKTKIIVEDEARGICFFAQYLALPALIFTSLATLSFENVQWHFLVSVLVAKASVFFVVCITTLLLTKPINVGKAGLYSIVSTQSNDLGLGYPLIALLYRNHNSDFPTFLYLIVPLQLLILNPVGFILMEMHKQQNTRGNSRAKFICIILKNVLSNPIVFMTALGMLWNLAIQKQIPPGAKDLIDALGSVFSTIALFSVGHRMSCTFEKVKGYFLLAPALLVITKILVFPLVLQKVTRLLMMGHNETEIQDLVGFSFLYGTLPCGPTIFIFAKQYELAVDVVTSTIVYSTLFATPLMIASATMISLSEFGFKNTEHYLSQAIRYTGVINMICCLWVIVIFFRKKRWHDICQVAVTYIVIAQVASSLSGIMQFFEGTNQKYMLTAMYMLSSVGFILTCTFTIFLAFLIFLLQWKSLCFVLRHRVLINTIGLLVPVAIALPLSVTLLHQTEPEISSDPVFLLGTSQVIAYLSVAIPGFLITVVFLIFQHRHIKYPSSEVRPILNETLAEECEHCLSGSRDKLHSNGAFKDFDYHASDIEDVADEFVPIMHGDCRSRIYEPFCNNPQCNTAQRRECIHEVENYENEPETEEIDLRNPIQYVHYVILLLCLCSLMLINTAVCISKLVTETSSGIMIELQFLNVIMSFGQGIICFVLFCLDFKSLKMLVCCKTTNEFSVDTAQQTDPIEERGTNYRLAI